MKKILYNCIFLIVISFPSKGIAQSLNDLINTALAKNYQIKILKNEAIISSNNNVLGNSGQLPSLSLNGFYSRSYNNTLQRFSDGSIREGQNALNQNITLSAIADWTLFNGFSVYARKNQLAYLEQLGEVNSKFFIEQTVADIVTAYHQLIYEQQLLENYRQSLEISAYRLKLENKRKEVGIGTILNYGQAKVDYQTDSIKVLAQINVIQSLQIELNRVLNNELEQEIALDDLVFTSLLIASKDSLLMMVSNNNNQLEQQRLQELIAETELRISKANRYPKIDLFAGYEYSKTLAEVGFFQSNRNFGPTVGVNVSFNLFNGGAANREVKNTLITTENIHLTKQQTTQNLDAQVLQLYNEYVSITKRITLANDNVSTSQKVYEVAEDQLKRGAINGYDFRLTQLSLLNAELTLMQLQFSLKTIEITLNRFSGQILKSYL